jgi:hypothetical protein
MTTMAAIDRLVHHSIILDMMSVESYRAETASQQHLPSGRQKKPSAGRYEATPSLPSLDAASISSQENPNASTSEDSSIDGAQSARLIATDGTI